MDNKLTFNHETGYYEGTIRIQVESEIFRRVLLKTIEDDPYTDLTNPETWNKIIERIAGVSFWMDRPHTRVTEPLKAIEAPKRKEKKITLKENLKLLAVDVPPHLWEEKMQTPILDVPYTEEERKKVNNLRYRERYCLNEIREEYEKGQFVLSEEAEKEEQEWRQNKLSTQIGTLENLVNGSKIH